MIDSLCMPTTQLLRKRSGRLIALFVLLALVVAPACWDRAPDVRGKGAIAGKRGTTANKRLPPSSPSHGTIGEGQPAPPAHNLEYEEFVTGGAAPGDKLPMVIAVHGLGDNPDRFSKLFIHYATPYRVIVPRGPTSHGRDGYSWFDTSIDKGRVTYINTQEVKDSARRLAALADDLSAVRPTRGKPVVMGFSQGGMLSYAVAVFHPDSISMAIPIGGAIMSEILPGKRADDAPNPPIVALHGERDRLVQFVLAEKTVEHLQKMGYGARLSAYETVEHRLSFEMRRELFDLLTSQAR